VSSVPRSRSPKTQRAPFTLSDVCARRKCTLQDLARESGARTPVQLNALCAALGCLYPSEAELSLAFPPEVQKPSEPPQRVQYVETPRVETIELHSTPSLPELPKRRRKTFEETPPVVELTLSAKVAAARYNWTMARHPNLVKVPLPPHPLSAGVPTPVAGDYLFAAGRWFVYDSVSIVDGVPSFTGTDVLTDKPVSHPLLSHVRVAWGKW